MSESDESAVLAEVSLKLKDKLKELQGKSHYNAICVRDPELWMKTASWTFQGKGPRKAMQELGISQQTYYKVQRQILDIRDEYKEFQLSNIHANIDAAQSVIAKGLEQFIDENGEAVLDLDKAKTIKELTVTGQILSQMGNRIADGADQKVKVEVYTVDDVLEAAKEAEAILEADFEEVEDGEG